MASFPGLVLLFGLLRTCRSLARLQPGLAHTGTHLFEGLRDSRIVVVGVQPVTSLSRRQTKRIPDDLCEVILTDITADVIQSLLTAVH